MPIPDDKHVLATLHWWSEPNMSHGIAHAWRMSPVLISNMCKVLQKQMDAI